MPDDADIAKEISERLLKDDLANHFRRARILMGGTGAIQCIDCNAVIPLERRQAMPGCCRCITCQAAFEILSHWRAL